jgi:hypothetical protein
MTSEDDEMTKEPAEEYNEKAMAAKETARSFKEATALVKKLKTARNYYPVKDSMGKGKRKNKRRKRRKRRRRTTSISFRNSMFGLWQIRAHGAQLPREETKWI